MAEEEKSVDEMLAANARNEARAKRKPGRPPKISSSAPAPRRAVRIQAVEPPPLEPPQLSTRRSPIPYSKFLAGAWQRYGFLGLIARPVYEGDRFVIQYGSNPVIDHAPGPGGAITGAYAVATWPNYYQLFEWISAPAYAAQLTEDEPVIDQLCKFAIASLLRRCPEPQA